MNKKKLDLWVFGAFLLLVPNWILESAFVNMPSGDNILMPYLAVIGIGMFAAMGYYLKRCGKLINYRYLVVSNSCKRKPRYINICFNVLTLAALVGFIFSGMRFEILYMVGYELIIVLLSISTDDKTIT